MAVIGAAMKMARQPETGRHYPSDRCPVASDGREQRKKEGKRGASLALGVRCNSQELVRFSCSCSSATVGGSAAPTPSQRG